MKTDCLLTQRLPKRFTERLLALEALRHPDGTPVYRVEETRPLLGSSRAPRMEAERPKQRRWNGVDDPISHCLAGNSLLLTGLPGTGKTHLPTGAADGRPLGAQVRARGQRAKLDWLVVEEITQLDLGGPGLRGAERRREVFVVGRLPAVAGRAGLLGRAAHQRAFGAQATWPAGTGTSSRRTCAPTPASSTS